MKRVNVRRAMVSTAAIGTVGISCIAGIGLAPLASANSTGVVSTGVVSMGASAPYCGIYWGSLDKYDDPMMAIGPVLDVRAGRHDCYDRLVIDQAGKSNHYMVGYVDEVRADASGAVVPLRGGAFLQVVFAAEIVDPARYHPADRANLVDVSGYRTFRQVSLTGGFEGIVSVGLGVRARLPFRVFTLDGPDRGSRLVIDVAHRW